MTNPTRTELEAMLESCADKSADFPRVIRLALELEEDLKHHKQLLKDVLEELK